MKNWQLNKTHISINQTNDHFSLENAYVEQAWREGVQAFGHLGTNLERRVREINQPLLMVPKQFTAPHNVMIAFDGSNRSVKGWKC